MVINTHGKGFPRSNESRRQLALKCHEQRRVQLLTNKSDRLYARGSYSRHFESGSSYRSCLASCVHEKKCPATPAAAKEYQLGS
jgi:hypothetical protein